MKGHKDAKKKTNPAAHLNACTQECAPQESSERAGGADSSIQVSHADSIMKLRDRIC